MKSCFFIGHRETPESIAPLLANAIEKHITEKEVKEFIVGNYGAFDRMATRLLLEAKQKHPEISIMLLTPYLPTEKSRHVHDELIRYYPPDMEHVPKRFAIIRANRYVIAHCDYLIAYVWHPASNARELLEYAQRRKNKGQIQIENLASTSQGRPLVARR